MIACLWSDRHFAGKWIADENGLNMDIYLEQSHLSARNDWSRWLTTNKRDLDGPTWPWSVQIRFSVRRTIYNVTSYEVVWRGESMMRGRERRFTIIIRVAGHQYRYKLIIMMRYKHSRYLWVTGICAAAKKGLAALFSFCIISMDIMTRSQLWQWLQYVLSRHLSRKQREIRCPL